LASLSDVTRATRSQPGMQQRWVVNNDRYAVARQPNIQLDSIRAVIKGSSECRESIFGREGGRAAMANDER
jgi:hypothetical protein